MATNPFFDPSSSYGGTPGWADTDFVKQYLDPQIPQGVYANYLAQQGFGGQDKGSIWAQNQYGKTQTGYQAALRQNPTLTYLDYLNQQFGGGGLRNTELGLTPTQLGASPSLYTPSTRVIAWG